MGQFSHYERYKRLNFSATFPLIIFQQKCKIPKFNLGKAFHLPAAKLFLPTLQIIPVIRTDMINIVLSICCLSIRMIDLFVIHSLHLSEIKLFQTRFQSLFLPIGDICPDKTGNFTESKRQISESPLPAQTSARRQGSSSSDNCNYFAQRRQAGITPNTVAARETKIGADVLQNGIKGYLLSYNTLHSLLHNKAAIEASCI